MAVRFWEFWRADRPIDRGPYALVGVVGFAVKHHLDRLLATVVFHRPWGLFNYLAPLGTAMRTRAVSPSDAAFLTAMVAFAVPFIVVGVALTMRRLKALQLPGWLVAIFFAPVVNVVFFALLSVLPSRSEQAPERSGLTQPSARPDHP